MTNDEFSAAIALLFGGVATGATKGAAEFLQASERNVKRWASGEKRVGPDLAESLIEALRAAIYDATACSPYAARNAAVIRMAIDLEHSSR